MPPSPPWRPSSLSRGQPCSVPGSRTLRARADCFILVLWYYFAWLFSQNSTPKGAVLLPTWKDNLAEFLRLMTVDLGSPANLGFVAVGINPQRISLPDDLLTRLDRLPIANRPEQGAGPAVLSAFCDHAIYMCQHAAEVSPATAQHINARVGQTIDYAGLFTVIGMHAGEVEPLRTMLYRTAILLSANHPVIPTGDGRLVVGPVATAQQLAHWAIAYSGYKAACGDEAAEALVARMLADPRLS